MTRTVIFLRAGLRIAAALAVLTVLSATAQVSKAAPQDDVLVSRDPEFADLTKNNAEIEQWRAEQQQKLREQGRATAEEFRKVDIEARGRAQAAETQRTKALESLSERAGIKIEQGPGGTHPASPEGRGSFSDIDTASMNPKDFQKVLESAKKAGYTVEAKGDSFTIKEIDTTVHRKAPGEMHYGSAEQIGSSGRDAEILRGSNKETAIGMGRDDPAISISDNLKKAAKTLNVPPEKLSTADLQSLGKMTGRNIEITNAVPNATGKPATIDPKTLQQAADLKKGFSPEAAGIVRDNATPEQRAKDIADFQSRSKAATLDAVRAADAHANTQMEKLAAEARHANEVLEATKATGDEVRIRNAQEKAVAAERKVIDYQQVRTGAQQAAVNADKNAAKVINEARGISNEGKSPSEIREAAVAADRKALASAAAEPTKAPPPVGETAKGSAAPAEGVKAGAPEPVAGKGSAAPAEGVKAGAPEPVAGKGSATPAEGVKAGTPEPVAGKGSATPAEGVKAGAPEPVAGKGSAAPAEGVKAGTPEPVAGKGSATPGEGVKAGAPEPVGGKGSVKATAMKGANAALIIYGAYEGVKRGAQEAGKEAAEGGDGALKSTAKVVGYSAWYGLGIGGAIETGKKAGEDTAKQWEKDVKEGKVDPTSKLSQAWAHIRGVGWGLAEFTGLQAIKDATVEGGGYVKDRYTQYKAEKAEAEAKAAAPQKPEAKAAAGDKATTPAAAGADKSGSSPDKQGPADGKDKAAADKANTPDGRGDKDKAETGKTKAPDAKDNAKSGDPATADGKSAADKTSPDKNPAEKDGADKAAADRTKGHDKDKQGGDKDKPIGSAIGAAGALTVKQPPVAQVPAVQQPVAPPAPPTTTEVDGGYIQDKNGKTKVVYINDANGNRIGGYYVKYDANGREIGRESFTESPAEPDANLNGSYAGRITGGSSGSLRITVQNGQLSGTIGGIHEGDPISATFSASISADGSFSAPASGVLRSTSSDGKTYTYGFKGNVSGRVTGKSGSGQWSGGNQWGQSQGTWQAAK